MKQKVLLTGFDPFGGEETNPSMEIAKALDGEGDREFLVVSAVLPVERFRAVDALVDLITEHKPDLVISLGVAVGRKDITLEKVAINFDDYRIADNGGNLPTGEPIKADGATAHFSTLPINRMCQEISTLGVPASVSFSAGTFVCNHLMYGALEHITSNSLQIRAGFIHVPQATEFAQTDDVPTLSLSEMTEAIKVAIAKAVGEEEDVAQNQGDVH